ncbi:MAG: helix-turn-helix domain-containing protein [Paramuribaculum sp.]|nr:helix-turn-helix domain-containing protein [Paramuribaculum sp.]
MKLYTHEEMLNRVVGEKGTARRDALETELQSYIIGEAIKQARKEKKLSQTQLGELMGVQRSQISRIENGHNLTINTIVRAFKAMGVPATLSFGGVSLSLC